VRLGRGGEKGGPPGIPLQKKGKGGGTYIFFRGSPAFPRKGGGKIKNTHIASRKRGGEKRPSEGATFHFPTIYEGGKGRERDPG